MNRAIVAVLVAIAACAAGIPESQAQTAASAPTGWQCGSTGGGAPKWTSEISPSGARVLKQSGNAPFPCCVKPDVVIADGFVEVKFMPLAGRDDQAGGMMWRWQDGDNYYVARANALENNVSLYYTSSGVRHTIQYVNAPVAPHMWHHLRADFNGAHITVSLDGKRLIETEDNHITTAGRVGVWSKADSVTVFDELRSGALDGRTKVKQ